MAQNRDRAGKDRWAAVKATVWARCGGRCESCSTALDPWNWDGHHRRLRSRGGPDCPSNVVGLCPNCHTAAPTAVHRRPADAERRGLMVPSWDDPEAAPVWLPDGRRVLLTVGGDYLDVPEEAKP